MIDIVKAVVSSYLIGGVAFVSYTALEVASLYKQHEATRDKNLKNSLISIGRDQKTTMKTAWKWPVHVFNALKEAFVWMKTF